MDKKEALERIKIIKKEAHKLQEIIDAPEKPKLRHGDFGYEDGVGRLSLKSLNGPMFSAGPGCCFDQDRGDKYHPTVILGNIFDLLEEWSKEPKHSFCSSQGREDNTIQLDVDNKEIWMGNADDSDWYSYKAAYEIWIELGKRLASLKRKENQND